MDGNGACSSRSFLDRFEGRTDPLSSSLSLSLSLTGNARPTTAQTAAKEVRFGVDGRAQMLMGVDKLADAVQVRLFVIRLPCVCTDGGWWRPTARSLLLIASPPIRVGASIHFYAGDAGPQGAERHHRPALRRAQDHQGRRDGRQEHRVQGAVRGSVAMSIDID